MSATLTNYIDLRQWPEALGLAIQSQPEAVEGFVGQAGNSYLMRGRYQQLFDTLSQLPAYWQNKPETLFWLFRSAFRLKMDQPFFEQVEALLMQEEAPKLRAFYASNYLSDDSKYQELKRAKQNEDSFFVRHHYALVLIQNDLNAALEELEDLCFQAQEAQQHFDYVQSLNLLGYCYAQQGRFKQTLACFHQVHTSVTKEQHLDWQLYLSSKNNLLHSQLIVNQFKDQDSLIEVLSSNLDALQTDLSFHSRTTLGDYWLVKNKPQMALEYHRQNFEAFVTLEVIGNQLPDNLLFNYVKMLLYFGKLDQAQQTLLSYKVSKGTLSSGEKLAECLLLVHLDAEDLQTNLADISSPLTIDLEIIKLSLEAYVYLKNDNQAKASELLTQRPINDLSLIAFRSFFATDKFDQVFNFWQGNDLLPIIKDPKAFEELANDEATWHRLALLKTFPDEIAQVRYAHYLSSQNEFEEALKVIRSLESFDSSNSLILRGIYMGILLAANQIEELESFLDKPIDLEPSALNSEGRMRVYEAIAGYLYTHCNQAKLAQKYLYWEQAIARELGLTRRLKIIDMLLEDVNTSLGEASILQPLNLAGLKHTLQKQQRQRFNSVLSETNIQVAQSLFEENYIDYSDYKLVQALRLYRDAESGQASYLSCAEHLNMQPSNSESKLYFALLCLQVFSKVGPVSANVELKRVLAILDETAHELNNLSFSFPLTAKIFPLGLAVASHLLPSFASARLFVPIVMSNPKQKGIFKANKKLVSLPTLVREAIVQDGLEASHLAFQSATSSKTGFTVNKNRFESALKKIEIETFELTNAGAIYRGLSYGLQDPNYQDIAAQALKKPYLQGLVHNL